MVLHASTTASSSAMLEQAQRITHDTKRHVTSSHVTTRTTRRASRVVTCRDVTQQVEFGLYNSGTSTVSRSQ